MSQIQQGDVLFELVAEVPDGAIQKDSMVIMLGEATGHSHRVAQADAPQVEMYEKDGVLYLRCKASVGVVHEEHKQVNIPMGTWRIGRVREYDHFSEEARDVKD